MLTIATPRNPHRVGGKPSTECKENTESKERLESSFDTLDSNLESSLSESKTITQSTESEALKNTESQAGSKK
ncbi:hypothetical protein [uncultured Helicobacter sp.]|uniref:hypothetical protein n=1 Tax=uncultured Helicobacter sp. TaxID=175537 RepID=UPI00375177E5